MNHIEDAQKVSHNKQAQDTCTTCTTDLDCSGYASKLMTKIASDVIKVTYQEEPHPMEILRHNHDS